MCFVRGRCDLPCVQERRSPSNRASCGCDDGQEKKMTTLRVSRRTCEGAEPAPRSRSTRIAWRTPDLRPSCASHGAERLKRSSALLPYRPRQPLARRGLISLFGLRRRTPARPAWAWSRPVGTQRKKTFAKASLLLHDARRGPRPTTYHAMPGTGGALGSSVISACGRNVTGGQGGTLNAPPLLFTVHTAVSRY
jgi:hypothetical protein